MPSSGQGSAAIARWISAAAATASRAAENARNAPSPAQSTSCPFWRAATACTSSLSRARTAV
jgi:hypothetical protein